MLLEVNYVFEKFEVHNVFKKYLIIFKGLSFLIDGNIIENVFPFCDEKSFQSFIIDSLKALLYPTD
jgi:hypothetical protein